ncbi:hypothetical protein Tco_0533281 [Tanacetum coccineum]
MEISKKRLHQQENNLVPPAPKTAKQLTAKKESGGRDSFKKDRKELGFQRKTTCYFISQKLSATTVTGKGTLLRNANQDGTKGTILWDKWRRNARQYEPLITSTVSSRGLGGL